MSRDDQEKAQNAAGGSKEKDMLSPDDGANSKKGHGHLHVPSRSSSQRIQPSPTSTGLSGATASDPRDSIGGHSKESKASFLGRRRNGSVSSKHSAANTGQSNTPGNSQPSSPAVPPLQKRKKGGGLLAIFGCCGVPDDANTLENGEPPVPPNKLKDVPPRPATASRRTATPSEQTSGSKTHLYEKEQQPSQSASDSSKTKRVSASTSQDQSTVGDRDTEPKPTLGGGNTAPIVTVDPPPQTAMDAPGPAEEADPQRDGDGDVEMRDAENAPNQSRAKQPVAAEILPKAPPPPQ